jgi:hypothetical protein
MKKVDAMIIIISILLGLSPSFGDNFEKKEFDSPTNSEYKIKFGGFFTNPGTINPNETIFTSILENKKNQLFMYYQYKYSGRTGEKTFEISLVENFTGKKEKISMYFDETNLFPLEFIRGYVNCSKDDKVFLKMIKLQGNQLEFQIILPDCLSRMK